MKSRCHGNMDHGRRIRGITVCMVTAYLVLLPDFPILQEKEAKMENAAKA